MLFIIRNIDVTKEELSKSSAALVTIVSLYYSSSKLQGGTAMGGLPGQQSEVYQNTNPVFEVSFSMV